MAKPIITIIGLGVTGASIGLGLQQQEGNFEIIGHDKEPNAAGAARKQGAVHRTEWNLYRACENAELIVLAVPLHELDELLELISEDLDPNVLVLAITRVMRPAIDIAAKHLPSNAHFVVGHPILSGVGGSLSVRADLFDEVPFCLAPGLDTAPDAIQLASDLVERLGAKPLYMDAQEHDGIIAGVEQLPLFVGAMLSHMFSDASGWVEAKKLAGRQFAQATEIGSSPERLFADFESNRENLLLRVDQLQYTLAQWRDLLALDVAPETLEEEEEHPLQTALKQAVRAREEWETQALLKNWDETPRPDAAEGRGMLQQMFFGNLLRGRSAPDEKEKDRP
jgi:prephenate dehydrogenase